MVEVGSLYVVHRISEHGSGEPVLMGKKIMRPVVSCVAYERGESVGARQTRLYGDVGGRQAE